MTERKNYITKQGYQRLKDELDFLVKVDRPKVVADVSWAASNAIVVKTEIIYTARNAYVKLMQGLNFYSAVLMKQ